MFREARPQRVAEGSREKSPFSDSFLSPRDYTLGIAARPHLAAATLATFAQMISNTALKRLWQSWPRIDDRLQFGTAFWV
jgi:hypothetical protein